MLIPRSACTQGVFSLFYTLLTTPAIACLETFVVSEVSHLTFLVLLIYLGLTFAVRKCGLPDVAANCRSTNFLALGIIPYLLPGT